MNDDTNPITSNSSLGFGQNNRPIISVSNVRIFRPSELKRFLSAIENTEQRVKFEALLYTGMRYSELNRLLENPDWFDNEIIHLTKKAVKKKKIKMKERYIHLNPIGRMIVRTFITNNKRLPTYGTWTENLKRWAKKANIDQRYLSPKTTRKTWESWLVAYYPKLTNQIFLSQGHNTFTALSHYVNLPFNDDEIHQMDEFVAGWK